MPANYNHTAWFYDALAQVVFGQAQVKAQNHFLQQIPAGSHILIVGGGTGQILEALTRLHPASLYITYVEIADRMVALSRKRHTGQNMVTYVTADIMTYTCPQPVDVIITAFLFDNFSEANLKKAFAHLHQQLKPGGLWLNTDFQLTGPLWQKVLLKSMYTFFKLLKAVDVMQLPDTTALFVAPQYEALGLKLFYGKFILSGIYRKRLI